MRFQTLLTTMKLNFRMSCTAMCFMTTKSILITSIVSILLFNDRVKHKNTCLIMITINSQVTKHNKDYEHAYTKKTIAVLFDIEERYAAALTVAMATFPGSLQSRVAGTCFRFSRFSFSLVPRAFFLPPPTLGGGLLVQPLTPPTARVRDLIASVSVVQRN